MLYTAADVPPEVGLGVKPWLVPPARLNRRALQVPLLFGLICCVTVHCDGTSCMVNQV